MSPLRVAEPRTDGTDYQPYGSADKSLSSDAFYGNYTGYFSNIGQGEMLANFRAGEPAIDYIAPACSQSAQRRGRTFRRF